MSHQLSAEDWTKLKAASVAEERSMRAILGKSAEERDAAVREWDTKLKELADVVRGIVLRDRKYGP